MNAVRLNEAIFNQFNTDNQCGFCWSFTYARKDYANLTKKDECCVHVFLHDFTTDVISNDREEYTQHIYTLKIVLNSLFDIQIFNELQPEDAKSKFADYIEPLLDCFPEAYKKEVCNQGWDVTKTRINAKYNTNDQNRDGIEIQYTIKQ